jgi:glycosyltransferase involved in cell wall biosynthesis
VRILQVIPFFTPQMGGSAVVAYQTARHLAERGHQVTVATSNYSIETSSFPDAPFEVIYFHNLLARWGFYITPELVPWSRQNVKRFDVIHMHTVRTFQNAVVSHFARRHGIPYVLSAHGTLPLIVRRRLPKQAYDLLFGRRLLQDAGMLIAVSEVEADQYRQWGIPEERIHMIYNGLDLDEFASLPNEGSFRASLPQMQDGTKLAAYLGRIEERKGLDQLIEAFEKLLEGDVRAQLVIAGPDEGIQSSLHSLSASLGLDGRVIFCGPLYGKDRLSLLVDADVVVLPAVHEIFGLVPFEALLCGTPVIVSDDSGAGHLVARANAGWLVHYGDVPGLAAALRHALTADQAEVGSKVRSGREFVRNNLDWKKTIIELENLYQEISI